MRVLFMGPACRIGVSPGQRKRERGARGETLHTHPISAGRGPQLLGQSVHWHRHPSEPKHMGIERARHRLIQLSYLEARKMEAQRT